jgi:hypothetical protein
MTLHTPLFSRQTTVWNYLPSPCSAHVRRSMTYPTQRGDLEANSDNYPTEPHRASILLDTVCRTMILWNRVILSQPYISFIGLSQLLQISNLALQNATTVAVPMPPFRDVGGVRAHQYLLYTPAFCADQISLADGPAQRSDAKELLAVMSYN